MLFLLLMHFVSGIEALKCHAPQPTANTTVDIQNTKLCFISVRQVTDDYSFVSYGYGGDCKKEECRVDGEIQLFCCSTDYCNTLSNQVIELSKPPSSKIWKSTIWPTCIVIIISLIPLISAFFMFCPFWTDYRHQFPDALHIDATHIVLDPLPPSSAELAVITSSTVATASPEASDNTGAEPAGVNVNIEAVITYGTNNNFTTREKEGGLICDMVTAESSTADILKAVLSFGPRELQWKSWLVVRILNEVQPVFLEEETLCSLPVTIYGDIHGTYSDLWRWFNFNGWPQKTRSVFLGDYVDRGKHSMEVILLLFLLKIMFPRELMLCRGNHEEDFVNKTYNFYSEVKYRLRKDHYRSTFEKFAQTFRSMPLACIVSGRIFCLHGGLTPKITQLAEIDQIQRPLPPTARDSEHCGLLWSDPQRDRIQYKSNTHRDERGGRGVGFLFGLGQIATFVKENDLSLIVRGHQPPMAGYERIGPYLLTLFSTAAYRTDRHDTPNMAACLFVDTDGTAVIRRFTVAEVLKDRRMKNKMDKGDEYSTSRRQQKKRKRRHEKYT